MGALLRVLKGRWRWLIALTALCAVLSTSACSIKLVATYDQPTINGLIASYESMDRLYERMNSASPPERTYSNFEKEWSETAQSLRSLAFRQKIRTQNNETTTAIQNLISMWDMLREEHRTSSTTNALDPYPQDTLVRRRATLEAQFFAVIKSEEFKK